MRERSSTLTIGDKRVGVPVRRKATTKAEDECASGEGDECEAVAAEGPYGGGGEQPGGAQKSESGTTAKNESENGMESGLEGEGGTEAEKDLRRKKVEEIRRVAEGWRGRGGRRGSIRGTRSGKTSLTSSDDNLTNTTAQSQAEGTSGEAQGDDGQLKLLMNEIDKQEEPPAKTTGTGPGGLLGSMSKGAGQRGSILVLDESASDLHQLLKEQHQAMLEAERTEVERKRSQDRRRSESVLKGNEEVVHLRKQIDELMAANLALTRGLWFPSRHTHTHCSVRALTRANLAFTLTQSFRCGRRRRRR
jgi:hypothetical protein